MDCLVSLPVIYPSTMAQNLWECWPYYCLACVVYFYPWLLELNNQYLFIAFLLFWGMVIIADSPVLSTLVSQNTELQSKAIALTIVNSIGFAITIVSIQTLSHLISHFDANSIYVVLAIGPVLGLLALRKV